MILSQLANIVGGHLIGSDAEFNKAEIDSRAVMPGDLFVALLGEMADGHQFVHQAASRGAVGALVSQSGDYPLPVIKVEDTLQAFHQLASACRQQCNLPVVAITGSYGKTTVRALCESICQQVGATLASTRSFNNHTGVPLTMAQLKPAHQYYIQEVGANHSGEIASLMALLQPTISVLIAAGPVHLAGFGDMTRLARAKGEIFSELAPGGTAILNVDDEYASSWRQLIGDRRCVTFGVQHQADVRARNVQLDQNGCPHFVLSTAAGEIEVALPLLGEHNVTNALAASAVAIALGIGLDVIKRGLESVKPVSKRLNLIDLGNQVRLLNDAYNANPTAVRAAAKVLLGFGGRSIFVLGDMKELGEEEMVIHQQMGQELKAMGIDQLYGYGELAMHAVDSFGQGGHYFTDQDKLVAMLKEACEPGTNILVKGSNSLKLWQVAEKLEQEKI